MALRKYGPGKFNVIVDAYVHGLTLGGWGDGLGDVENFGYYHVVELGKEGLTAIAKEAKAEGDKLTLEEARLIRKSAGAILEEDSQGFVNISYFKTKKALDKAWEKIEREYEKFDEEYGED